jgi:type I restriction-modification system DNA methylase subunit
LTEEQKPLLVGGTLISLRDQAFISSYRTKKTGALLASLITRTIKEQLQDTKMNEDKIKNMIQPYSFIETHPVLSVGDIVSKFGHPLSNIIDQIETNLMPFINTYSDSDVLGHFYGEFLSYTAGDKKGLGIVLTPKHIKELMCELVDINKDSILLDTCTGTAGFLITAMHMMMVDAKGDQEKIANIKSKQLIGIEQQPHMFALAVSNMLLRGDGKANIYNASCFGLQNTIKEEHKPTAALLNPPYSQKGEGLSELDFIQNALECLEPNGLCAAIIPISCGNGNTLLREKILKKNTLLGVISLPMVFKNVGVKPGIFIFKAGIPHDKTVKTWFAILDDDGFENVMHRGRLDPKNRFPNIKKELVKAYKNKETQSGKYITKEVSFTDEWLGEAYVEPDYSTLKVSDIKYYSTKNKNDIGITLIVDVKGKEISKTFRVERCQDKTIEELLDIKPNITGEFGDHKPGQLLTYGLGFEKEFEKKYNQPLLPENIKSFNILELFTINRGKGISSQEAEDNPGDTPFITACTTNNGVACYTSLKAEHLGNCLTITQVGEGVCTVFYQEKPFIISGNANILEPKFCLTLNIAMYLKAIIEANKFKFNYGYILNTERLAKFNIPLPVKDDKPDWEYIENFVNNLVEIK